MVRKMSKQYGEDGFIPTIENVRHEEGTLVLETIDPREKTNIVSTDEGLKRKAHFLTDEQKTAEKLL
jgi:hypothetical protein